jgi:hypothetical protein
LCGSGFHCDKIPEAHQIKRRVGLFRLIISEVSDLVTVQSVGPVTFGPVVKQYIMARACGKGACSLHSQWEAKRETRSSQGPCIPFKGISPMT